MKHLVDIDDELLDRAQSCLGTSTIKATVDEALRRATDQRTEELREGFKRLAEYMVDRPEFDRSEAWR